jgi:1-acyl-sn-glycerol-3-phosphate acyltransferase
VLVRRRNIELRPNDIDPAYRYLLVSNHQSGVDFGAIFGCLPPRVAWRLAPVRRVVWNAFFEMRGLQRLHRATGGLPSHPHERYPHGLRAINALLDEHQSFLFFPEGERTLPRAMPPRNGVAVLANRPDVRVVPIHIQWYRRGHRRWLDIAIARPFDASGMTPLEIMDVVYGLPLDGHRDRRSRGQRGA